MVIKKGKDITLPRKEFELLSLLLSKPEKVFTREEIFENKEQIEVSKFYERLPKPHAIAIQEWLENKIYYRNTQDEEIEN